MMLAGEHLEQRQADFHRDQHNDDPFQPHGAVGVDEIGQSARRLADHVDLGVERAAARFELILVLEARIKALEIGAVP